MNKTIHLSAQYCTIVMSNYAIILILNIKARHLIKLCFYKHFYKRSNTSKNKVISTRGETSEGMLRTSDCTTNWAEIVLFGIR